MEVDGVIKAFGGAAKLARKLDLPQEGDRGGKLIRAWLVRGCIPPGWYRALSDLALREGVTGITTDALAEIAERRRHVIARRRQPPAQQAA